MTPPFSGLNKLVPYNRSASKPSRAAAKGGNASRTRIAVSKTFQEKIDIRNIVIPGARIVKIVVMKLTPPRIVPTPLIANPTNQRSEPIPGEYVALDNGA